MRHTHHSAQEARHYRARLTTHGQRKYPIFPGVPTDVSTAAKNGLVLIAGPINSGRSFALLVAAVTLAKNTPAPRKGQKHLMQLVLREPSENWVYATLVALFEESGRLNLNPWARQAAKSYFAKYGFELIVERSLSKTRQNDYEVIHVLVDDTSYSPGPRKLHQATSTGMRIRTARKSSDGNFPDPADFFALMYCEICYTLQRPELGDQLSVIIEKRRGAMPGAVYPLPPVPGMRFD